jgi:hypothetical protein
MPPRHPDSRNIKDAHPALQAAWPMILSKFEKVQRGYTLHITCTHRTPEMQMELFKKGRHNYGTIANPDWQIHDRNAVVTNCDGDKKHSKHSCYPAEAIDVVVVDTVSKKAIWLRDLYEPLGKIAKDLGLEWGGGWATIDDPYHIQIGKAAASSAHLDGFQIVRGEISDVPDTGAGGDDWRTVI